MKWFMREWWSYLLEKKQRDFSWLQVIRCRMRAHPAGVVWYNFSERLEPDMTCKSCGDDLG